MITKPILDTICKLDMHWFFFCCGALVNAPSSLESLETFADEYSFFFLFSLLWLELTGRNQPICLPLMLLPFTPYMPPLSCSISSSVSLLRAGPWTAPLGNFWTLRRCLATAVLCASGQATLLWRSAHWDGLIPEFNHGESRCRISALLVIVSKHGIKSARGLHLN